MALVLARTRNWPVRATYALIVFGHVVLLFRVGVFDVDRYMQFLSPKYYDERFWTHLYYFHANPPGLSALHYVLERWTSGQRPAAFWVLLLVGHCSAYSLFLHGVQARGLKMAQSVSAILLLNPMVFC